MDYKGVSFPSFLELSGIICSFEGKSGGCAFCSRSLVLDFIIEWKRKISHCCQGVLLSSTKFKQSLIDVPRCLCTLPPCVFDICPVLQWYRDAPTHCQNLPPLSESLLFHMNLEFPYAPVYFQCSAPPKKKYDIPTSSPVGTLFFSREICLPSWVLKCLATETNLIDFTYQALL